MKQALLSEGNTELKRQKEMEDLFSVTIALFPEKKTLFFSQLLTVGH